MGGKKGSKCKVTASLPAEHRGTESQLENCLSAASASLRNAGKERSLRGKRGKGCRLWLPSRATGACPQPTSLLAPPTNIPGAGCRSWGTQWSGELSVDFIQFCCEPKAPLEIVCLKITTTIIIMWEGVRSWGEMSQPCADGNSR